MKKYQGLLGGVAAVFGLACALVVSWGLSAADNPHAYFDALVARSDFWKGYSLRPKAGQPISSVHYENQLKIPADGGYLHTLGPVEATYDPAHDTDPYRQDAAKVTIPPFAPYTSIAAPMAASTSGAEELIQLASTPGFDNNQALKVGDEIVVYRLHTELPGGPSIYVLRGQFGTAATAHNAGTRVDASLNSLRSQIRLPLGTPDGHRFLFTWDAYWTSSYVHAGFGHKAFQITSIRGKDQWFEVMTQYTGPDSRTPNPAWNPSTDVASVTARGYSPFVPPVTYYNPIRPLANPPFIIKPNRWTRFWVVVEANREGDATKFSTVTTLAAAVGTPSETLVTINHSDALYMNPFTSALAGSSWPGRSMRIDDEIVTIVSGPSTGSVRQLTVVRGAYGTTPTTHAAGATVQLVHDYISLYVADQDRQAICLYDRLPGHLPISSATPELRGTMNNFWVEFDASETALVRGSERNLVAYVRNFAALMDPAGDISTLLLRPESGVPPSAAPGLGPPTNLRVVK